MKRKVKLKLIPLPKEDFKEFSGLPTPPELTPRTGKFNQYSSMVIWENGMPKVAVARIFDGPKAAGSLKAFMQEALNLPYSGGEPEYQNLSKGEVILLRLLNDAAGGDHSARSEVMDRVMGKPLQTTQSVNLRGSLEDFLDSVKEEPLDITPVSQNTKSAEETVDDL